MSNIIKIIVFFLYLFFILGIGYIIADRKIKKDIQNTEKKEKIDKIDGG